VTAAVESLAHNLLQMHGMSKVHLTIDDCMSPSPYAIEHDQPVSVARAMMRDLRIRHLPVTDGGTLVGMVSSRDLHLLDALEGVDPATVAVSAAMSEEPYAVERGTDLREVAINMGSRKYGSAVVLDAGAIVGVFTTVDAMRVLANLL